MEKIQEFLNLHLPTIISYAIIIISYILYFIIKAKVGKSSKTLRTLVKEKIVYVDKENDNLKKLMTSEINKVFIELDNVKKQNSELQKEIATLKKRQKKSEGVLITMVEEDKKNEIPIE